MFYILLVMHLSFHNVTDLGHKQDLQCHNQDLLVVVVDETTANRLLNCTPDSCSLVLSEALADFTDYGEGVMVSRQSRGSAVVTESKVSLFVCLGPKGKNHYCVT